MKSFRKPLSLVLTLLMVISSVTMGLAGVAFGADINTSANSLGGAFFNGTQTVNIGTESFEMPKPTILGDMSRYTVSNKSDAYVYADAHDKPIRSLTYIHTVEAGDNKDMTIRRAYGYFTELAAAAMNATNEAVTPVDIGKQVKAWMVEKQQSRFFDGYLYYVDGLGQIVSRSREPVYTVDSVRDGVVTFKILSTGQTATNLDDVKLSPDDVFGGKSAERTTLRDAYRNGTYKTETLYDAMNVGTVIDYFLGNCTTVNSGNWFHTFRLVIKTDTDYVLSHDTITGNSFHVYEDTVNWRMDRTYDDSGTKPSYSVSGIPAITRTESDYDVSALASLRSRMPQMFSRYYALTNAEKQKYYLDEARPATLASEFANLTGDIETFNSISNDAKKKYFTPEYAYEFMNMCTQLTPANDYDLLPKRVSKEYKDLNNRSVVYKMDRNNVAALTSTVDGLMGNTALAEVLNSVLGLLGGDSLSGVTGNTPKEILQNLIKKFLYQDSIINLILEKVYPMLTNLLDEMITNEFISGALGGITGSSAINNVIEWLIDNIANSGNGGWQAIVYAVLMNKRIGLTPAGFASVMRQTGYNTRYPAIYAHLLNAKGGTRNNAGDISGLDANTVGQEGDIYCNNRWKDVNFDQIIWGINGDKQKFQDALACVLSPVAPLLGVLLAKQRIEVKVASFLGGGIYLQLNHGDEDEYPRLDLYDDLLLPLLEALGLDVMTTANGFDADDALKTSDQFRALADAANNSYSYSTVSAFINKGLLNPILTWVEQVLLNDPMGTIAKILPNLSYFLTSGALLEAVKKIDVHLFIGWGSIFSGLKVYTLSIRDILKDKLDFLDSVQGVLNLIGLSAKGDQPIVGYYDPDQTSSVRIYRPGDEGYNASKMTEYVTSGFSDKPLVDGKVPADAKLYKDYGSAWPYEFSGLDAAGELIKENVVLQRVGWADAAGTVITAYTETQTPDTFNVPVYDYYTYNVIDDYGVSVQYIVGTLDEIPADIRAAETYEHVMNPVYNEMPVSLPAIMDYKLQSCGTLTSTNSYRQDAMTITDGTGNWAAGQRKYIAVDTTQAGLVFVFLMRYLLSALEYREWNGSNFNSTAPFINLLMTDSALQRDIAYGLTVGELVDNMCLHPDECIAALSELFTYRHGNEKSQYSYYDVVATLESGTPRRGTMNSRVNGKSTYYTYGMDYVDYHHDEIAAAAEQYNDYSYGTSVLYSEYWTKDDATYVMDHIDELINNVLVTFTKGNNASVGGFDLNGSLRSLIDGVLADYLTDATMSDLIGSLFVMLDSVQNGLLREILPAAVGVDYSKIAVRDALKYALGGNEVGIVEVLSAQIRDGNTAYDNMTFYRYNGEPAYWGLDDNEADRAILEASGCRDKYELLVKEISAIASPFAGILRFLFTGEDLSVCRTLKTNGTFDFNTGILNIPGYEGYQYAWIPLMEALSIDSSYIRSYAQYFAGCYTFTNGKLDTTVSNFNTVYYLLRPIVGLIESVLDNPLETVLGMIPNLMFYLSIGSLSDTLNNLVHPIYVLLDMLNPIYDAYPTVNSFLSNLEVGGMALNLSVPLDFDFNQLANTLIDSLLGNLTTFDITPNKLNYKDVPDYNGGAYERYWLKPLYSETERVYNVAKSADGTVSTVNTDGSVPVWEVARDENGNAILNEDGSIRYKQAFNNDGDMLYVVPDSSGAALEIVGHGSHDRDCYYVRTGDAQPIYEWTGEFDALGMPIAKPEYEKSSERYTDIYESQTSRTLLQKDDTSRPIPGTKKQATSKEIYYAWGTLKITLPYIDFATLCAGTLVLDKSSITTSRNYVYLRSDGGADLLTLALRLVMDTIFMDDNKDNIANFLIDAALLDDTANNDDFLREILDWIYNYSKQNALPDKILKLLATVYRYAVPLMQQLGMRFNDPSVDFNLIDVFNAAKNVVTNIQDPSAIQNLMGYIQKLANAGNSDDSSGAVEKLSAFGKFIQLIKRFFENIKAFFTGLFKRG